MSAFALSQGSPRTASPSAPSFATPNPRLEGPGPAADRFAALRKDAEIFDSDFHGLYIAPMVKDTAILGSMACSRRMKTSSSGQAQVVEEIHRPHHILYSTRTHIVVLPIQYEQTNGGCCRPVALEEKARWVDLHASVIAVNPYRPPLSRLSSAPQVMKVGNWNLTPTSDSVMLKSWMKPPANEAIDTHGILEGLLIMTQAPQLVLYLVGFHCESFRLTLLSTVNFAPASEGIAATLRPSSIYPPRMSIDPLYRCMVLGLFDGRLEFLPIDEREVFHFGPSYPIVHGHIQLIDFCFLCGPFVPRHDDAMIIRSQQGPAEQPLKEESNDRSRGRKRPRQEDDKKRGRGPVPGEPLTRMIPPYLAVLYANYAEALGTPQSARQTEASLFADSSAIGDDDDVVNAHVDVVELISTCDLEFHFSFEKLRMQNGNRNKVSVPLGKVSIDSRVLPCLGDFWGTMVVISGETALYCDQVQWNVWNDKIMNKVYEYSSVALPGVRFCIPSCRDLTKPRTLQMTLPFRLDGLLCACPILDTSWVVVDECGCALSLVMRNSTSNYLDVLQTRALGLMSNPTGLSFMGISQFELSTYSTIYVEQVLLGDQPSTGTITLKNKFGRFSKVCNEDYSLFLWVGSARNSSGLFRITKSRQVHELRKFGSNCSSNSLMLFCNKENTFSTPSRDVPRKMQSALKNIFTKVLPIQLTELRCPITDFEIVPDPSCPSRNQIAMTTGCGIDAGVTILSPLKTRSRLQEVTRSKDMPFLKVFTWSEAAGNLVKSSVTCLAEKPSLNVIGLLCSSVHAWFLIRVGKQADRVEIYRPHTLETDKPSLCCTQPTILVSEVSDGNGLLQVCTSEVNMLLAGGKILQYKVPDKTKIEISQVQGMALYMVSRVATAGSQQQLSRLTFSRDHLEIRPDVVDLNEDVCAMGVSDTCVCIAFWSTLTIGIYSPDLRCVYGIYDLSSFVVTETGTFISDVVVLERLNTGLLIVGLSDGRCISVDFSVKALKFENKVELHRAVSQTTCLFSGDPVSLKRWPEDEATDGFSILAWCTEGIALLKYTILRGNDSQKLNDFSMASRAVETRPKTEQLRITSSFLQVDLKTSLDFGVPPIGPQMHGTKSQSMNLITDVVPLNRTKASVENCRMSSATCWVISQALSCESGEFLHSTICFLEVVESNLVLGQNIANIDFTVSHLAYHRTAELLVVTGISLQPPPICRCDDLHMIPTDRFDGESAGDCMHYGRVSFLDSTSLTYDTVESLCLDAGEAVSALHVGKAVIHKKKVTARAGSREDGLEELELILVGTQHVVPTKRAIGSITPDDKPLNAASPGRRTHINGSDLDGGNRVMVFWPSLTTESNILTSDGFSSPTYCKESEETRRLYAGTVKKLSRKIANIQLMGVYQAGAHGITAITCSRGLVIASSMGQISVLEVSWASEKSPQRSMTLRRLKAVGQVTPCPIDMHLQFHIECLTRYKCGIHTVSLAELSDGIAVGDTERSCSVCTFPNAAPGDLEEVCRDVDVLSVVSMLSLDSTSDIIVSDDANNLVVLHRQDLTSPNAMDRARLVRIARTGIGQQVNAMKTSVVKCDLSGDIKNSTDADRSLFRLNKSRPEILLGTAEGGLFCAYQIADSNAFENFWLLQMVCCKLLPSLLDLNLLNSFSFETAKFAKGTARGFIHGKIIEAILNETSSFQRQVYDVFVGVRTKLLAAFHGSADDSKAPELINVSFEDFMSELRSLCVEDVRLPRSKCACF